VPRQHSSGGRPKLLGIGAGGNGYLRKQLIQGVLERRGSNRAAVALATKTARIAWVLLARGGAYRAA
jgi:transposase